jgi:hypothetical protein
MSRRKPSVWVVLRAHAKADPRKTAVLILLVVAMVVVYMRTFSKPSSPSEVVAVAQPVVTSPATPVPGTSARPSQNIGPAGRVALTRPLQTKLDRDPFAVDPSQLSGDPRPAGQAGAVSHRADPHQTVEELAHELELQSTICGKAPMACINGVVVQEGDDIAGFRLERVEPRRVILRRDGILVALNMNWRLP